MLPNELLKGCSKKDGNDQNKFEKSKITTLASNKKEPEATTEGQKLFQRIKVKDYPLKD